MTSLAATQSYITLATLHFWCIPLTIIISQKNILLERLSSLMSKEKKYYCHYCQRKGDTTNRYCKMNIVGNIVPWCWRQEEIVDGHFCTFDAQFGYLVIEDLFLSKELAQMREYDIWLNILLRHLTNGVCHSI